MIDVKNSLVTRLFTSPVKAFVLLSLIFGMSVLIIVPPFSGADEEAHFVRAYGISRGNFVIDNQEKVDMPVEFRNTLGCLQDKVTAPGVMYEYSYDDYGKQKKKTVACMLSTGSVSGETEQLKTTAPGYSPLTFIPQVAAIYVASILKAPLFVADYFVRVAVLFAYIGMAVIAIRLTPNRKWAMVGVLLLPTAIMQVTNPGADYMIIGSTAVFIAGILYSRRPDAMESMRSYNNVLILVTVAAVCMILTKGIFPGICILPLIFFFRSVEESTIFKERTFRDGDGRWARMAMASDTFGSVSN